MTVHRWHQARTLGFVLAALSPALPATTVHAAAMMSSGTTLDGTRSARDVAPVRNGRIAFIDVAPSGTDAGRALYTVPSAGGRATPLSPDGDTRAWFDPAWSPDGRRLAVARAGVGVVVHDPWYRRTGELVAPDGEHPSWSPDGRRLAFAVPGRDGAAGVYLVDLRGRARRRLAPGGEPAWSSRDRIAFTAAASSGSRTVFTMRPDGSDRRPVASGAQPAWSLDGRRLAVVRSVGIHVVASGGGTSRRLVRGADPAWSPDGTMIVFTASREGFCNDSLWTIRPDGSRRHRLVLTAPGFAFDCVEGPAWQPRRR